MSIRGHLTKYDEIIVPPWPAPDPRKRVKVHGCDWFDCPNFGKRHGYWGQYHYLCPEHGALVGDDGSMDDEPCLTYTPPEPTCGECGIDISDQWDLAGPRGYDDGLCDGCRDVIRDDNARREWNRRNGISWRETQAGM